MSNTEFSRMIDIRQITADPVVLVPDEAERRRLSGRFGITSIESMRADLRLSVEGAKVEARGRLKADIVQAERGREDMLRAR